MVEVAFFYAISEAMMFKGILNELNIECIVEPTNDALAAYSPSLSDGVRLMVMEYDEDKARELLKEAGYIAQ